MEIERQREQLSNWLRERSPSEPVTLAETHISILAFQGDLAYKMKKSVRYPFIDLSTPERRLADCERELRLNRRLSPDVYLGVEAVTKDRGTIVEHVVVMRRMPESRRLSSLVRGNHDVGPCIDRIAGLLAGFHASAPTGGAIDAAATRDAVGDLWARELSEFSGPDMLATLVHRYLAGRRALFDARVAAGRARDGHGDLLADDVYCLDDGPRVLDCLEFDDRLRFGDVLADVSFLAMDLERLGRPDLAERFLARYQVATGDEWPPSLAHLYIAYRAHVRAKIAAISGDDAGAQQRLGLVLDHLERGRIRLVLVGGPPATGKTTVARAIAAAAGWPLLRSDVVRKELAGLAPTADATARLDEGLYTSEWNERTYESLCSRARELLRGGFSVVLDASWSEPRWREMIAAVAVETTSDLVAFRCQVPIEVAIARAAQRAVEHEDASDADADITAVGATRFVPWPEVTELDTRKPPETVASLAFATLGAY